MACVLHGEGRDNRAGRQQIDLEAAVRHGLDALDILPRHFLEYVG